MQVNSKMILLLLYYHHSKTNAIINVED